jgi:hypothetical protein
MAFEPVLEEWCDGPGKAHRDVAGERSAGLRGGREEVRQLVVVEARVTGAVITPTGMSASESFRIAASRRTGREVRGSMTRLRSSSRVVKESATAAASCLASSESRSMSLITRWFFVTMTTGLRNPARTWRQPRVIPSFRSTGWYGSVTPLIESTFGSHRGEANRSRKSPGASSFTRTLLSKSSPAERPRYSCVGRE